LIHSLNAIESSKYQTILHPSPQARHEKTIYDDHQILHLYFVPAPPLPAPPLPASPFIQLFHSFPISTVKTFNREKRRYKMASTDQTTPTESKSSRTERRRSSASKPLFSTLTAHTSNPDAAARRASFGEQKVGQPTVIGKLWNNWIKGDAGSGGAGSGGAGTK